MQEGERENAEVREECGAERSRLRSRSKDREKEKESEEPAAEALGWDIDADLELTGEGDAKLSLQRMLSAGHNQPSPAALRRRLHHPPRRSATMTFQQTEPGIQDWEGSDIRGGATFGRLNYTRKKILFETPSQKQARLPKARGLQTRNFSFLHESKFGAGRLELSACHFLLLLR
ncbi:unnamed protein product [Bemisia tabaci]|uniref:Uncharacterized protein n=1 Tax=Bemisia tabaci TaxID=7038 RepID=A0A9P0ADR6_BEMTA|nr:unnamed protein product [Bemisia tabaci]